MHKNVIEGGAYERYRGEFKILDFDWPREIFIYRKAKKMVPMIGKVLYMEENVTLMSL